MKFRGRCLSSFHDLRQVSQWEEDSFGSEPGRLISRDLDALLPNFGIHWSFGREAALQTEMKIISEDI